MSAGPLRGKVSADLADLDRLSALHGGWIPASHQVRPTAEQIQRETHSHATDRCLSSAAQKILGRSLTREERLAFDEHLGDTPQLTSEQLTEVVVSLFQSLDFRFPE